MVRGRQSTPEQAAIKGLTKKNPQRYRKITPKNKYELGQPPEYLSDGAKQIWFEMETYCLPGTLTGAERFHVEAFCTLFAEFRANPPEFTAAQYAQIIRLMSLLGLNPIDRQKLGVEKPKEEVNEFKDF